MIAADVSGVNITLLSGKWVYYVNVINSSSIMISDHAEETESTAPGVSLLCITINSLKLCRSVDTCGKTPHTLSLPILLKKKERNGTKDHNVLSMWLSYPFYCREVGEERKKDEVRNDTEKKAGKERMRK